MKPITLYQLKAPYAEVTQVDEDLYRVDFHGLDEDCLLVSKETLDRCFGFRRLLHDGVT